MRVVPDEDVDRVQVYRRRRPSRALLIARELSHASCFQPYCPCMPFEMSTPFRMRESAVSWREGYQSLLLVCQPFYSGGYGGGVPPLPIPNREVKPACADGTAMQCGRVGGCRFFLRMRVCSQPERTRIVFCSCQAGSGRDDLG